MHLNKGEEVLDPEEEDALMKEDNVSSHSPSTCEAGESIPLDDIKEAQIISQSESQQQDNTTPQLPPSSDINYSAAASQLPPLYNDTHVTSRPPLYPKVPKIGDSGGGGGRNSFTSLATVATNRFNYNNNEPTALPERNTSLGVKIGGSEEDLEDRERETLVIPPDGGWGWVVVAASFMCNVMVDGIIFTCGMLLPSIKEEFKLSYSAVSWVSSLLGGSYLLAGPFVSSLANAYGFRTVCIIGAIMASASSAVSYYATGIYYLYFTYGILAGIGFGFIYVPAVIATGFYFEKRRALATGMAVCGSGIGTFSLAPLINMVLSTSWGWRGVLLVNAGLILTCIIYGLAFRPLSATTGKVIAVETDEINGTPLLMRIKLARDAQLKACMSDASIQDGIMTKPGMDKPFVNPSMARIMQGEGGGLYSLPGGGNRGENAGAPSTKESQRQQYAISNGCGDEAPPRSATAISLRLDSNKNETTLDVPTLKQKYRPNRTGGGCTRNESAPSLSLANRAAYRPSDLYRRGSKASIRSESIRPFYRDDIFYSGSLVRLPQYTSSESVEQYHASVTQIPPEVIEEELENTDGSSSCFKGLPAASKAVLTKMFDFGLCTSPTFLVLSFAGFLTLMSLFVPFNFLPSFINSERETMGLTEEEAEQTKAFLMALIGICNTIGRVVCGWVSDHPKVDAIMVNNVALIIGGVATCLIPFIQSVSLLYLYGIVFGFSVAVFASLRSILLVELLGLEKLTNAFGLLLLIQGVAALFGSPIAGGFADVTGNFTLTFYVFGATYAVSGIMCIPIRRIKKWETERLEKKLAA